MTDFLKFAKSIVVHFAHAYGVETVKTGYAKVLLGERSEPPHWGVQSRFRVILLGERSEPVAPAPHRCSIEISRDICCRYVVSRMSVVCQINCVGGITCPTRMLKVFWGRLNQ